MSARVKHFSSTQLHALKEERHFALVEGVAFPTVGSLVIVFRPGTRSDPCISSVCNCDHDYYFELLVIEERNAQSITRCWTAHHRDVRAVPRANRTCTTVDSPTPDASSSKDAPPACGPSRPWRFSVLAASSGGDTCCTFHQRELEIKRLRYEIEEIRKSRREIELLILRQVLGRSG